MKWRRQRIEDIDRTQWHRVRIWWPRHDAQSNTTYCLCRVWRRWVKVPFKYWSDSTHKMETHEWWVWEYRDGGECPDVKQVPLLRGKGSKA